MSLEYSTKLQGRDFFRGVLFASLAFIIARTSSFGVVSEKSTMSLVAFSGVGVPLICAAFWWRAPRAQAWASLSLSARFGGNRRKEALRVESRRLLSALMLVLLFTWTLLLSIYDTDQGLLRDIQVTAPLMLLVVFAQAGVSSACYAWAGRIGLSLMTLLSLSVGLAVQPLGTILPIDLSKQLFGGQTLINESITTPHAALALLAIGLMSYGASLWKVAP